MPRLVIDDREIEVPKGTKVIEAAERLGIVIPRFCFHEALGAVGACRVCAVKFVHGPFKGVQMSCMVDAQDDMVVSTTDEEAVEYRKSVIEWLMLNHPHDCPVCDEGGQCLLQDLTVAGGHSIRRYEGRKRTYQDQYLGPFIQHEMNRCIHCYRCSRFYQEYAGYRDLGAMQIANRVYFGRYADGQLESPFSGNLVDICPTGVYTDKPARFKARRWDMQRSPSICIHCSLGCNTTANARYREVVRVEARVNDAVNGHFICDLGRFGFPYADHPGRPRSARVDGLEARWDDAVRIAAERLKAAAGDAGAGGFAALGSTRSSLEAQAMLHRFCRLLGWSAPTYFLDPAAETKVRKAVSELGVDAAVSLAEIETADFVLALGVDPVNEAPMLAMAMRQAHRKGARIVVADPRPVFLPFDFDHLPVGVRSIDRCLNFLMRIESSRADRETAGPEALDLPDRVFSKGEPGPEIREYIEVLSSKLAASGRPIIVCGTDIVRETTPHLVAELARSLSAVKGRCGLFYVFPGANSFGAALCTDPAVRSFPDILEKIESDSVTSLLVVESDPFCHYPDQRRLEKAINKLKLLIVFDYLPSGTAQRSHIFLPTSNLFETGSTFINQEGRIQYAGPVHSGGIPICQETCGGHPNRVFRKHVPGREQKAAWQALADLAWAMSPKLVGISSGGPWKWISEEVPVLGGFDHARYPFDDVRIPGPPNGTMALEPAPVQGPSSGSSSDDPGPDPREGTVASPEPGAVPGDDLLDLLTVEWTFGTEELSGYSCYVREAENEPSARMHSQDAAKAGLADGDRICIPLADGPLQIKLEVSNRMAKGVLVVPRHRRIAWQKLSGHSQTVALSRIGKI
jgi:NADH-quinone oxidoreductase subunit G